MKRAALAMTMLAATSGVASAGGYLGLGVGTGPALDGDVELYSVGRSGKLLAGSRFGQFSIEGALGQFDARLSNNDPLDFYQASIAGKVNIKLGDGFEAFGKLGLQRTWLNHSSPTIDRSGNGYLVGAGIEYRLDLAVASGSIFLDYQYNDATLVDHMSRESEVSARMWTIGLMIGI